LSGLVAVTASCAVVEPYMAIVIGVVAGWLYMYGSSLLVRLRIDDAVDAIPVHMINGAWGMLATGLFASPSKLELTYGNSDNPGFFYSFQNGVNGNLLLCQVCAVLFIFGWAVFTMVPFFLWLNFRYVENVILKSEPTCEANLNADPFLPTVPFHHCLSYFHLCRRGWLRADSLEELVGLDISYHGNIPGGVGSGVKKEYVDAYNRHKSTVRRRSDPKAGPRMNHTPTWMSSGVSESGPSPSTSEGTEHDRDQEAAIPEGQAATP
jgi:Ammonium Transporter Family